VTAIALKLKNAIVADGSGVETGGLESSVETTASEY
jgi:hypothetical protein